MKHQKNWSNIAESNYLLRRCFVLDNQRRPLGSGTILTEILMINEGHLHGDLGRKCTG